MVAPGIARRDHALPDMPSTVIRSIRYLPESGALEVGFTTGRCYLFHDVPEAVADAFRVARIKGRHFNSHIRGRYAFSACEPETTS